MVRSTYWTVLEQETFPSTLSMFGTDWTAISQYMGTKSPVMVSNARKAWQWMQKKKKKKLADTLIGEELL